MNGKKHSLPNHWTVDVKGPCHRSFGQYHNVVSLETFYVAENPDIMPRFHDYERLEDPLIYWPSWN